MGQRRVRALERRALRLRDCGISCRNARGRVFRGKAVQKLLCISVEVTANESRPLAGLVVGKGE
jgi:hypothetical protein